jgi:hypothetical protein
VAAITVDASDPASLRDFFTQVGPLDDLVLTVTRRGGAGPAGALAEQDLIGAFAGKTVAQLQAVALALPHLAPRGSITLVTAGSAQSALPGTCGCRKPMPPGDTHESRRRRGHVAEPGSGQGR